MTISRNAPCPCGSGKKYKHCHGALGSSAAQTPDEVLFEPDSGLFKRRLTEAEMAKRFLSDMPAGLTNRSRPVPPGFIVMEDFIPQADLEKLHRHARDGAAVTAKVQDSSRAQQTDVVTLESRVRITEKVDVAPVVNEVWELITRAYAVSIEHFDKDLAWIEAPAILRYPVGGLYRQHSDNSYWDRQRRTWVRGMDRDLSLLIYLNGDFEGGAVYFPNFDLRIQPKAGMMVAFPSDHRYLHAAEEVTAGERYAIVSWSVTEDSPKLRPPPAGAVVIKDLG